MKKGSFFYSTSEIAKMKQLIRTGQPLMQIARNEHVNFGVSQCAFYTKLTQVARRTKKIRDWDGPKRERRKIESVQPRANDTAAAGLLVPQGTTFEGTPKRVEIFTDHFRIYF